jgi:hypothetical protein
MTDVLLVSIVFTLSLGALIAWRHRAERQERGDMTGLRLSFNRSTARADVEQFLSAVTGLRLPWWKQWFGSPVMTVETTATSSGIRHDLIVSRSHRGRIDAALRAQLPGVRVEDVAVDRPDVDLAAEYRLTKAHRLLRVDDAFAYSALTALSHLSAGDRVTVQWQLTPSRPLGVPRVTESRPGLLWGRRRWEFDSSADAAAAKEKWSSALFPSVLRIGVKASTHSHALQLLRQVEAPLHATAAPGVHLTRRWMPKRLVARRLVDRRPPGSWPVHVNAAELSGLLWWPFGSIDVPGLAISGCRQLPLSAAVPRAGTMLGEGVELGRVRPAAMSLEARYRHLVMIGATGTGKTTLLTSMALNDIAAGHATVVIDPKGEDLVDGVLERLDPEHLDRVAVLDLADHDHPVGFNPLRQSGVHPELAVEHLVGTMRRVWSQAWGLRTDDLVRMALRTLVLDSEATVADVVPLLTEPAFRRPFVERVTDPSLAQFWRQYGALSDGEAAQWYAPATNKLRTIVARPSLRRIMGQAQPKLDIAEHLSGGGVLLVPLNSGRVGEEAASLFGALLLGEIWNLIQQRRRNGGTAPPLMVYLDEASRYAHLPVPLEELLSQARSFGVGVTLAIQHLAQLSPELRHAVLSNPRSRIAFQVGSTDARTLATEFGQKLTADDLQGLDAYEVVAQVFAHGRTQPAATLTTRPPAPVTGDAELVRRLSRDRWGVDGDAVDAAINDRRHSPNTAPDSELKAPTGRKRRSG